MNRTMKIFLLFFCCFFVALLCDAQNISLEKHSKNEFIGKKIKFFEDKSRSFSLEKILALDENEFISSNHDAPNFQITHHAFWSKMTFHQTKKEVLFLNYTYFHLDTLDFYVSYDQKNWQQVRQGANISTDSIPLGMTSFVLKLDFSAHDTINVVVRAVSSTSLLLPIKVFTLDEIVREQQRQDLLYGIFLGLFIITLVYNLFLYLSTKDISYLHYLLYVLFIGLYAASYKGYASVFLLNFAPTISVKFTLLVAGLAGFFAGIFTIYFLGRENMSKKVFGFILSTPLFYIFGVFAVLLNLTIGVYLIQLGALLAAFIFPVTSWKIWKNGFKPARFYIIGWTILTTFVLIFLMKEVAILPLNFFTDNCIFIGASIEIAFLSFALADKINFIKENAILERIEKEKAQAEALKFAEEKEMIMKSQRSVLEKAVKKRTELLNTSIQELEQINEEMSITAELLEEQNKSIDKKNKTITESINYASKIQAALLPNLNNLSNFFEQSFTLYQPRDIVSGDFYWFEASDTKNFFVAAADCTGHGIPGSLMSMIGINSLNQIVIERGIRDVGKILDTLDELILKILRQNNALEIIRDGMDIALCKINLEEMTLEFSGAMRPLILLRNGELFEYKGDKMPIASTYLAQKNYHVNKLSIQKGDIFYIYSDGIVDQFDKEDRKKFGSKRFRNLLVDNIANFENMKTIIETEISAWKGETNQTDDILVMGFKI